MTATDETGTDVLLRRAALGDGQARQALLERHRGRLRRMVALRIDRRLNARIDPSDVVQEALAEAGQRLDGYLARPPLPFYPWLRQFAWERPCPLLICGQPNRGHKAILPANFEEMLSPSLWRTSDRSGEVMAQSNQLNGLAGWRPSDEPCGN
ncbi:MAG: hypothetical protein NVSMB9_23170 [Isosphaeraceae bacterium]